MHLYNLFGSNLNGLELVTYILIPTAMISIILLYIITNIKLIELFFGDDFSVLEKLDSFSNDKQKKVDLDYSIQDNADLQTKEKV